jgi:hypothetical protein
MPDYEFSEKLIREMVVTNHRPIEVRDTFSAPTAVRCGQCHEHWPCPTLRAMREWEDEALKKKWMRLSEEERTDHCFDPPTCKRHCHCPDRCNIHWQGRWRMYRAVWGDPFPTYTSSWTWGRP